MKLNIRNLLNHRDLEVEIMPGINLITGHNGDGKTNLSRIIGAMASHSGNPAGLSAAHFKSYITDGKTEGYAQDERGVRWTPPSKFVIPDGVKALAHPHTVNLIDFVANASSTDRKKRSDSYEALFLPKNPAELLTPAWEARGLPKGQLKTVLELLNNPNKGWNAAQKLFAEKALECKRGWQNVTGKRWGAQAAPKWKPEGWEADMEGLSEDDVLQALSDAQEALRAIGVKHAVSEDRIARAVEVRDKEIPPVSKRLSTAHKQYQESMDEYKLKKVKARELKDVMDEKWSQCQTLRVDIQKARREVEQLQEMDYPACWSCGVMNEIVAGSKLQKPTVEDGQVEKEIASWTKTAEGLEKGLLEKAEPEHEAAKKEYFEEAEELAALGRVVRNRRDAGVAIKAELDQLKKIAADADAQPSEGNDLERSAAENERDRADRRRRAWVANDKAQKFHKDAVGYLDVEELLRPTGVREAVIAPRMDKLRACLTNINKLTGWNHIDITADYELLSNDRPVALVSQHERYQAQWAMQIAVTMLVPSTRMLVLDCCDVVRGDNWDGLVNLVNRLSLKRENDIDRLKGAGKPAPPPLSIVICATETEAPLEWNEIWIGEEDE